MCKGLNKIVNDVVKSFGIRAIPSKKNMKRDIVLYPKYNKIRYNVSSFKNKNIDEITKILKNCIPLMANEESVLYV